MDHDVRAFDAAVLSYCAVVKGAAPGLSNVRCGGTNKYETTVLIRLPSWVSTRFACVLS